MEQMTKKFPQNGVRMTLSMVDVPMHILKKFKHDVPDMYGNIYWVKLMDLMRKAEAYDVLIQSMENDIEYSENDSYKPETKEEMGIKTFAGVIKKD